MVIETLQATVATPIGMLAVYTASTHLLGIRFLGDTHPLIEPTTAIAKNTVKQLQRYFSDPHHPFDIPIRLNTREFQTQVLHALQKIPVGKTRTYQEIAQTLDTGPRSVGTACRHNPLPIIIPCHRWIQ